MVSGHGGNGLTVGLSGLNDSTILPYLSHPISSYPILFSFGTVFGFVYI